MKIWCVHFAYKYAISNALGILDGEVVRVKGLNVFVTCIKLNRLYVAPIIKESFGHIRRHSYEMQYSDN